MIIQPNVVPEVFQETLSCLPVPLAVTDRITVNSHSAQFATFPMCWTPSKIPKRGIASRYSSESFAIIWFTYSFPHFRFLREHFAATKLWKLARNAIVDSTTMSVEINVVIHASSATTTWLWILQPRDVAAELVLSARQAKGLAAMPIVVLSCPPKLTASAGRNQSARGAQREFSLIFIYGK